MLGGDVSQCYVVFVFEEGCEGGCKDGDEGAEDGDGLVVAVFVAVATVSGGYGDVHKFVSVLLSEYTAGTEKINVHLSVAESVCSCNKAVRCRHLDLGELCRLSIQAKSKSWLKKFLMDCQGSHRLALRKCARR